MSNKTELQLNNLDLQAILDTVNNLPENEGGGGSGYVIKTFTVSGYSYGDGDEIDFVPISLPFIVGMTWDEWISSGLNMEVFIHTQGLNRLHPMVISGKRYITFINNTGSACLVTKDSAPVYLDDLMEPISYGGLAIG